MTDLDHWETSGDQPQEACGVFGIFAPGADVARATYCGLYTLQHRGQESAGIAVADGTTIRLRRDMIRGSTSRPLVALLRHAGAREIHLRIASPPYQHPCHLGMDTSRRSELIAANNTLDEILQYTGADSLEFLSIEWLIKAISRPGTHSCRACLDGRYPMPVQAELEALASS